MFVLVLFWVCSFVYFSSLAPVESSHLVRLCLCYLIYSCLLILLTTSCFFFFLSSFLVLFYSFVVAVLVTFFLLESRHSLHEWSSCFYQLFALSWSLCFLYWCRHFTKADQHAHVAPHRIHVQALEYKFIHVAEPLKEKEFKFISLLCRVISHLWTL